MYILAKDLKNNQNKVYIDQKKKYFRYQTTSSLK